MTINSIINSTITTTVLNRLLSNRECKEKGLSWNYLTRAMPNLPSLVKLPTKSKTFNNNDVEDVSNT